MGSINGKMVVSGTLSLKATSKIWGQIKTKILSIEPEAQFTGSCEMGNANNYTICFDTGRINIDTCADVIIDILSREQ